MSRVRRAITAFFFLFFLSPPLPLPPSTNVVISSFIECMPVESHFRPPFPNLMCECVCVCVGGGVGGSRWGGGCASACQYM